ncbi:MAG: hypothetical protein COB51_14190 [Moraxellaceae bacterium]|nr:MAG: hypothetical protein COB51_14190 [Moraxellaceae bacterium]
MGIIPDLNNHQRNCSRLLSRGVVMPLTVLILTVLMLTLGVAPVAVANVDWMDNAKKSIVTIKYKQDRFNGVITSPDGVVFSVSHGFDNQKTPPLEAYLHNGQKVKMDLLVNDPYADIAIFKLRNKRKKYHFIKPASKALIADQITVLGKLSHRPSYSIIDGKVLFNELNLPDFVSGQKKYLPEGFSFEKGIFHTATTKPGLSGSALLSANGELIGINNLSLGGEGDRSRGGFTIGIDLYLDRLNQSDRIETPVLQGLEDKLDFLLEGLQSYGYYVLRDQVTAETLAVKLRKASLAQANQQRFSEAKTLQWVWKTYIREVDALKKNAEKAA